jgi:DNA-binding NarL/FixJ family response regulator
VENFDLALHDVAVAGLAIQNEVEEGFEAWLQSLPPRKRLLVEELRNGATTPEIAQRMEIPLRTVQHHIQMLKREYLGE